jgi:predicted ATP-grasp superfamily ATP-dependent carboligase
MKILALGVSVRAMVESAVKGGYSVVALDAFGDRDLAAMAESHSLHHDFNARYDVHTLFEASRKIDCDAIAYTANLENHPEILRRFAKKTIIGNSPQTIQRVRHWETLFPKLRQAGFPVPETIFGQDSLPSPERRWLIKPIAGGGGHGIEFLTEDQKPANSCMIQEFIPGKPCSASFAANGKECVLLGVAEQLIGIEALGAHSFRYCGNILLNRRHHALEQIRSLAMFLTREYGLTGLIGIDFILDEGQVKLLEVNPRFSSSMELIEQAYNLPMFHIHCQAALEGILPDFDLESIIHSSRSYGKAIVYAKRDFPAPDMPDWAARNIRDVPRAGESIRKGSPVCTLFASGASREETLAGLSARAGNVSFELGF